MPALIGGAGLAVDTAQWYMWKRELQFAVDQAAIAGAWSRAKEMPGNSYQTRALREFSANQAIVDFAATPTISLADYSGGDNNSVVVTTTATRMLPFSSFLTGQATTVFVSAQASFEDGESYSACLLAIDEDDSGAITIGGNATLTASCGMAALSDSASAVVVNGNPQVDIGWILASGGIDDWFDTNTDDEVHEYLDGLEDPFAGQIPPTNPTPRTYSCSNGSSATTATVTQTIVVTYTYLRGSSVNNANTYIHPSPQAGSTSTTSRSGATVPNGTAAGASTSSTSTSTRLSGSGQNTIWEVKTTRTTTSYSNLAVTVQAAGAHLLPGTYSSLDTRCNTTMAPGVYVVDGGTFSVRSQDIVAGSGVMIVLRNGAGININGGASVSLTGMTASQLMAAGVNSSEANTLAGMLIYEDPRSQGNNGNRINGNASTILNGTVYLPRSNITFSGTARVTSQCLMIVAATITIQGTANMETFCPASMNIETVVATTTASVRLVS